MMKTIFTKSNGIFQKYYRRCAAICMVLFATFTLHATTVSGPEYENLRSEAVVFPLSESQQFQRAASLAEGDIPGIAPQAGFGISAALDAGTRGTTTLVGDTLLVWQLMIKSPEAVSTGLILKEVNLSPYASLRIYGQDYVSGPYTRKDHNEEQILVIPVLPGSELIVEYTEIISDAGTNPVMGSHFRISEVIHVFLDSFSQNQDKSLGSSGPCQVNINCSEGDDWQVQKRGIARMLMRVTIPDDNTIGYFWCSGSLINNTAQDGTPYFLSAAHCGQAATPLDRLFWQFYFNYERPACENVGNPQFNMLFGAQQKSSGPLLGGSDFQLLRLNSLPPAEWKPYFNGWSRVDEPATHGVGIHHPAGDAKKISTFSGSVTSASPVISGQQMADHSTWRLIFIPTANGHGVTEGGSSGSPMFNQNKLIVGTLTGGSSSCSNPHNPNYYGKMSYHWESNGDDPSDQLKGFLDPIGSGVTHLGGMEPYAPEEHPSPGFTSATQVSPMMLGVSWFAPGEGPNEEGWKQYATNYTHLTWAGPQRATFFSGEKLGFSYPAHISKLSHRFVEHGSYPWPSDQFQFKVYGSDGFTLLYESDELTAEHLVNYIYELEEPLVMEDHFYVAVQPVHSSGHPSTLMVGVNFGAGISFNGSHEGWNPHHSNNQGFAYLTGVYLDASKSQTWDTDQNTWQLPEGQSLDFLHLGADLPDADVLIRSSQTPLSYRVYRNGQPMGDVNADAADLTFWDNAIQQGFNHYHVTALYSGGYESEPSNTASVLVSDPCETIIDNYPYQEVFDMSTLPDCFEVYEHNEMSWQLVSSAQGQTIDPAEGSHFLFVSPSAQWQQEWLVTPFFEMEELSHAALRFMFIGGAQDQAEGESTLKVFARKNQESFKEIWDARSHPQYAQGIYEQWLQAVVNLSQYAQGEALQLGFSYQGEQGVYFGLDQLEVFDPSGSTFELTTSIIPSDNNPHMPGQVTGHGHYISGERVRLRAYPNVAFDFQYWEAESQLVSTEKMYDFLMPGHNLQVTAVFAETDPAVDVADALLSAHSLRIYPNPGAGQYQMEVPAHLGRFTVQIYNSAGTLIQQTQYAEHTEGSLIGFDISGQANGLYFVVVQSGQYREVKKVSLTK